MYFGSLVAADWLVPAAAFSFLGKMLKITKNVAWSQGIFRLIVVQSTRSRCGIENCNVSMLASSENGKRATAQVP